MTLCIRIGADIDGVKLCLKDTCFMKGGVIQKAVDVFETMSSFTIDAVSYNMHLSVDFGTDCEA